MQCENCLNLVHEGKKYCNTCQRTSTRLQKFHVLSDDPNDAVKLLRGFGKNKRLMIGISGGVDSCMVATLAGEAGLTLTLLHFDNGWNSSQANTNIFLLAEKYGFRLKTNIMDWSTFRSLQRSFLKASVPDIELVTDHAIFATMLLELKKNKIDYMLSGANFCTEHGLDLGGKVWNKLDILNIWDINRKFENTDLARYPTTNPFSWALYRFGGQAVRVVNPLNNFWYKRSTAIEFMKDKFGFQDYGYKHEESVFTKVYQRTLLPKKFNVVKVLPHINAQIRNKEITKTQGMRELEFFERSTEANEYEQRYVRDKLGFSELEWNAILNAEPKRHDEYRNLSVLTKPATSILGYLNLRSMD